MRRIAMAAFAFAALATSVSADVVVEQAWARATPPGTKVGVVYGQIRSDVTDDLVALSSPVAERVEIHTSVNEGGMMKMRMLNALALPAGTNVQLKPAGIHVMLTGLHNSLVAGTSFDLTLRFRTAPPLTIKVKVVGAGEEPDR